MLKIRFAKKDDLPTIVNFNSAMAMETESIQLDAETVQKGVKAVFNDANLGFYLLAENDRVPVGQLMITKEWSDWRNSEFWWIQSVYVHRDYRNKKIFNKLYANVVKKAKKSGNVCGIRLYVDKENTIAQKVYSKLGMKESNYVLFEEDWSDVQTI